MNIRCPQCQTVFRVDPSRIPEAGVRARCSRCATTFTITREMAAAPSAAAPAAPAPAAAAAPAAPPVQAAPPVTPPAPAVAPSAPAAPVTPAPAYQPPPAAAAPPSTPVRQTPPMPGPPAPPPPAAAPAAEQRTPVFGSKDPNSRAQRIARALVSDIVAYHPKRRDACLEAGNLRTEFREEIMKSWEEYVAQVGLEMAKSTPYFRDALNAILAKGQSVF